MAKGPVQGEAALLHLGPGFLHRPLPRGLGRKHQLQWPLQVPSDNPPGVRGPGIWKKPRLGQKLCPGPLGLREAGPMGRRGWRGPVLGVETAGGGPVGCGRGILMLMSGAPSLPSSPQPLWRKSPISPPRSQDCWGDAQSPALGPGREAPLALSNPLRSVIPSQDTHRLPSPCQGLGMVAMLSSLWSRLLCQSCPALLASRPTPDPLSFPWPISCGTFMQLSVLPMLPV